MSTKVSKSGDTITGRLVTQKGCYVHNADGIQGTLGYTCFYRITISDNYHNSGISIKVNQRGKLGGEIKILFKNANNADQESASIK